MRILIGEISSYKAIVIARYINLHYPQCELWAYDNKQIMCTFHSRYVKHCAYIAKNTLDDYINQLADYISQNKIELFIPVHSDYIGYILKNKHLFGSSLEYLGQYEDYIQLHQKNLLLRLANKLHIRIPKEYSSIDEAQVPFVIKPTNLSSAKGVKYCYTNAQKKHFSIIPTNMIYQEYISGQGCGYEVYCHNGKIQAEYGHIRLAEWPSSGGSSVLRSGFVHPNMRSIAEKILGQVQWTGFAMFEFKLTHDNQLVLIEVNPRIWGSINQALQDGCALFSSILGEPISSKTKPNVRTCLKPQLWLSLIVYIMQGKFYIIKDYFKHYKHTYNDVSFWDDPKAIMSILFRKLL